jgi:tellurite methyltransferase
LGTSVILPEMSRCAPHHKTAPKKIGGLAPVAGQIDAAEIGGTRGKIMDERERWNARYTARGDRGLAAPSAFLRAHLAMLPKGDVLELAMGEGHNAIFLAQHGISVTGLDISDVAVERARRLAHAAGVTIEAQQMDLAALPLPTNAYDVVTCFHYLQRNLLPQILTTLRPGGMVVYETFSQEQAQYGHPINPGHLLQPNELLKAFQRLRIRVYRDVVMEGPQAVVSLIAEKISSL